MNIRLLVLSAFAGLMCVIQTQAAIVAENISRNGTVQYESIQAAINAASNGDTILILPGVHTEALTIKNKSVSLVSRFFLDNNISWRDQTVLDGSSGDTIIDLKGTDMVFKSITLSGLTIQNALNNPALSIDDGYADVLVKQCVFENNINTQLNYSEIIVTRCAIKFEDVKIQNNVSTYSLVKLSGDLYLKNVKISGNTTSFPNLLVIDHGNVNIENSSICNNTITGVNPKIVDSYRCNLTINHSTIAGNTGSLQFYQGNGDENDYVSINNSIIWGTNSGEQIASKYLPKTTISNTVVKGGSSGVSITGSGQSTINIIQVNDPLFQIIDDDYKLSNLSPCLGKGAITDLIYDIGGIRRPPVPYGSYPDPGAYENLSNDNITGGALNWRTKVIYSTITGAVTEAEPFDTVIVLEGTHVQAVNLTKSLTLASTYILTGNLASINNTILDGQGNHQIISCEYPGGNIHRLIGVSLKNGFSIEKMGGGIFTRNQKLFFAKNCIFDGNFALAGSAIYSANSENIWIEDCIFRNNNGPGSVIGVNDADHVATHLTTLRNVLIHNNSTIGELIVLKSADIDNVTCVNNTFGDINKYSLYTTGVNVDINNSIFWNTGADYVFMWGMSKCSISNCNVRGGTAFLRTGSSGTIHHSNIISTNPLFTGNYHLSNSSPCIATGGPSPAVRDLDGVPRIGKHTDMGCYENTQNSNCIAAENITHGGEYISITEAIDNAANGDTILIYPGIHKESVNTFDKDIGITLLSMYPFTHDSSYIKNTIVDNQQKNITINLAYHYTSSLIGLTVRGGYAEDMYDGSAVTCPINSTVYIRNCIIENSISQSNVIGSANYVLLENTVIRGNSGEHIIKCRNSKADITNCQISGNYGVPLDACSCPNDGQMTGIKIQNTLICNNVVNNDKFIASNAILEITSQPIELNHVTIAGNTFARPSLFSDRKAILKVVYQTGKEREISIVNSIFWNPGFDREIWLDNPTSCSVVNCGVEKGINGNGIPESSIIYIGNGVPQSISRIIANNPHFANESGNDFHLQCSSPLIDAGVQSTLKYDIDNNIRPAGTSLPDIGCYEHNYIDTGKNMVPVMQSNTLPWGTAASNSNTNQAWYAFDGDNNSSASQWISSAAFPAILSFDFPFESPVVRYLIVPEYGSTIERTPKNWEFQAYDAGTAQWVTLDRRSDIKNGTEWSATGLSFAVASPALYKKYRLYITQTNGGTSVAIRDLKLYGPENACPVIQTNNAASFTATSSSEYTTIYSAWKAFDGEDVSGVNSRWISKSVPAWISGGFVTPRTVKSYYIQAEYGLTDRGPKNWTLEGWQEETSSWVTVDSRSNIPKSYWTSYGQYFKVANPGTYMKYRLSISTVNGSSVTSICKFKLFEQ